MPDSVRQDGESSRKRQRQSKKDRQAQEKLRQAEELKRMKAAKRKEVVGKLRTIAEAAGLVRTPEDTAGAGAGAGSGAGSGGEAGGADDGGEPSEQDLDTIAGLPFSFKDLSGDFDEADFDKKMAAMFDDKFYAEEGQDDEESIKSLLMEGKVCSIAGAACLTTY
jgi:hypothetical protein